MKYIQQEEIDLLVEILENNGVIAVPTETVYGLATIAKEENYNKLVKIKNRPDNKPFTLMISSLDVIKNYVEINEKVLKIVEKFTPGPLTIIVKTKEKVPYFIDLGTGYIGFRIPKSEYLLNILKKINKPLLVPSANPSFLPPAKTKEEVYKYFKDELDAIVDGSINSNIPSTIIKIDNNDIILIRQGELSLKTIMEAII